MVEEIRRRKSISDSEPLYGLDRKSLVGSTTNLVRSSSSNSSWNIPLQKIYRTLKFEKESSDGARTFMSLNVVMITNSLFEIILRIGVTIETSLRGETIRYSYFLHYRFYLRNLQMVDSYVQNLKFLFSLQDQSIRCVADVTNSTIGQMFMKKNNVVPQLPLINANVNQESHTVASLNPTFANISGGLKIRSAIQSNRNSTVPVNPISGTAINRTSDKRISSALPMASPRHIIQTPPTSQQQAIAKQSISPQALMHQQASMNQQQLQHLQQSIIQPATTNQSIPNQVLYAKLT